MLVLTASNPDSFWLDQVSPRINALWRGAWKKGTVEPPRFLTDHELVLVTSGSCDLQIGGKRHHLEAGQFAIIPPDTQHSTTTATGVFRYCIHFDWTPTARHRRNQVWHYFPKRPQKLSITPRPPFVPKGDLLGTFGSHKSVPSLLETLLLRWQMPNRLGQSLARATLLEILIILLSPARAKQRPYQPKVELACRVRDLLEQPSGPEQGIQQLLRSLGFSYSHLCRLFRGAFGVTPVEYRNALRLERAKALLPDLRLTIAEIAYEVGFTDTGYFSRQFRRQNGLSPRELRQQLINL